MQKMMLIVNPKAGHGRIRQTLPEIINYFKQNGWDVTLLPTKQAGDATRYVTAQYQSHDLCVCCGGDGTLHETMVGLMKHPLPAKLGYIPMGTSNDLAKTLGLSHHPLEAAKMVLHGVPFAYDIGNLNGSYFTYVAACGTYSDISYATPQWLKRHFGKVAYILKAIHQIGDIQPHPMQITIDDTVVEGDFATCAVLNSRSFGGLFRISDTEMQLDDSKFEVLLIRHPHNPVEVYHMMMQLIHRNYHGDDIRLYHGKSITVKTETPLHWCRDGEFGGVLQHAAIKACEKKLTFLANPTTVQIPTFTNKQASHI